ncbi:MAG: hypothetical protein AB1690_05560 [Candidatus Zixiibacteriota bacterium]
MSVIILILVLRTGLKMFKRLIPGVLVLAVMLNFGGCTLVGFTVGYAIDESTDEYAMVKPGELGNLQEGRDIKARMTNGLTATGKYVSLVRDDSLDYRLRYERLVKKMGLSAFPNLGDTVSFQYAVESDLRVRTGENSSESDSVGYRYAAASVIEGVLAGFDQGYGDEPGAARIFLDRRVSGEEFHEKLKFLAFLTTAGGDTLRGESLIGLVAEHKVPMRMELLMKVGLLHDRFPQEEILEVQAKKKRNAKLIGTIIGAAIDAAWIIAMATYDWDSFSWGGGGSY